MPRRIILKPQGKQHHNDFSFIPLSPSLHREEDTFIKACRKRTQPSRRHTISCSSAPPLLNELLTSLMVPFIMTDVDEDASPREGRHADDQPAEGRTLNAVSFDDVRDRSASHVHQDVSGTDPTFSLDEKRSAFSAVSASYQEPSVERPIHQGQQEQRDHSNSSGMPVQAAQVTSSTDNASDRRQFQQGAPRHHARSHHERAPPHSNQYPYPTYGYHQGQPPPYPYDYSSGYYHQHSEGDISGQAYHPTWPEQGYNSYSQSYQDYAHSYYSSSPHHMHPSQLSAYHPHSQMYEDPYHTSSSSRHPHSAPPSYHRGYARTTPPLGSNQEAMRHPQQYKETPSAITEGTTPSKQSPPLELSPEMSTLFGDSDDERKPAAKRDMSSQSRSPAQASTKPAAQHPQDDFEPIPYWNEAPPIIGDQQYRGYPPAAAASASQEYRDYLIDPTMIGLPPRHYQSTPNRSSAAPVGGTSTQSSVLPAGGEGSSWEKRFSELLDFRAKHGHCEVPQNYKENTSLGIWVNKQRMEQKLRIEGKNSSLNDARLQRLESVGFRWAKRKGQVSWNEKVSNIGCTLTTCPLITHISIIFLLSWMQFEELKAYKKKHGNVS